MSQECTNTTNMGCTCKKMNVNTHVTFDEGNRPMHCRKICCTQIWCPLLTHVSIFISRFWRGIHFKHPPDKAMCLINEGSYEVAPRRWNANSMKHFDRLSGTCIIVCGSLQETNKEDESLQRFFKKRVALLLCTDIAAHGLDFPALHWMIQLDCSKDANAYIQWATEVYPGTATYEKGEKAFFRGSWYFKSPSDK